jgi:hypothetical protein
MIVSQNNGRKAAYMLVGLALAAGYEPNPTFKASETLPKELLSGPRFKVDDTVATDGFTPTYVLTSDFGRYEARGREVLEIRVQEIAALDKLDDISKGDAFAKAMGQSAAKTGKAVVNVATNPVETAAGVPKGVGRFFKSAAGTAKKAGGAAADAVTGNDDEGGSGKSATDEAKDLAGASKAKRAWAKEAKVDPYSTNPALQKKLDDLSTASTAGGLAVSVLNPIGAISKVATVNGLVWDVPAPDLQKMNDGKLATLGVAEATRKAFFASKWFTPTQDTGFVAALETLAGATGVDGAVALAARRAQSEEDARFYRRAAEILALYQKKVGPITGLESRKALVLGHARSGALVVPAAMDLVTWSPDVDAFTANPELKGSPKEIWLYGQATERARAEIKARGWTLKERVLD